MIDETGSVGRKEGSGRLQSVHTEENIKLVIVHELTIDRRSVSLVIEQDLDLRTLRKRQEQKLTKDKHWKVRDPFKKFTVKVYSENITGYILQ